MKINLTIDVPGDTQTSAVQQLKDTDMLQVIRQLIAHTQQRENGEGENQHGEYFETDFQRRSFTSLAKTYLQEHSSATTNNYITALRKLEQYAAGRIVNLEMFNAALMRDFQAWLIKQKISMNTISCYLRSLRSLYNKIVTDHHITDTRPFRNVFTGKCGTPKRGITMEQLRTVLHGKLPANSKMEMARDMFMFSFFAMGMPFVDMAHLLDNQVTDSAIVYLRHKTGQRVVVPLLEPLEGIISKYSKINPPYVLPILMNHDQVMSDRYYRIRLGWYNHLLRKLTEELGLPHVLTSYTPRHSWATLAYLHHADIAVISQALGHTSPSTTQIYINPSGDNRLRKLGMKMCSALKR